MEEKDKLFEGSLDIVGDVHGQFDALQDLLANSITRATDRILMVESWCLSGTL